VLTLIIIILGLFYHMQNVKLLTPCSQLSVTISYRLKCKRRCKVFIISWNTNFMLSSYEFLLGLQIGTYVPTSLQCQTVHYPKHADIDEPLFHVPWVAYRGEIEPSISSLREAHILSFGVGIDLSYPVMGGIFPEISQNRKNKFLGNAYHCSCLSKNGIIYLISKATAYAITGVMYS